jgi:hypothetical protein
MTSLWDNRLTEAIRRLRDRALSGEDPDLSRSIAEATGALPVYGDMGGYLVIRDDGEILRFDPENAVTVREDDLRWRLIARSVAAERFPELASLRPSRPADGRECSTCRGTGLLEGKARCGTCFGLGWTL